MISKYELNKQFYKIYVGKLHMITALEDAYKNDKLAQSKILNINERLNLALEDIDDLIREFEEKK